MLGQTSLVHPHNCSPASSTAWNSSLKPVYSPPRGSRERLLTRTEFSSLFLSTVKGAGELIRRFLWATSEHSFAELKAEHEHKYKFPTWARMSESLSQPTIFRTLNDPKCSLAFGQDNGYFAWLSERIMQSCFLLSHFDLCWAKYLDLSPDKLHPREKKKGGQILRSRDLSIFNYVCIFRIFTRHFRCVL